MNKLWLAALFCVFTINPIYAQKGASKTHFALTNGGWVGGDGAYSIAINDTTRLWLFGDSMIGPIKDSKRSGVDAIHNCVALEAGDGSIHYYLRDKKEPFFINQRKDEYYWPRDGIRIDNKLYVFLARTVSQQGGLGFAGRGQDLAIITINSDNPLEWPVVIKEVPGKTPSLGSAITRDENYVYFFGDTVIATHVTFLARISPDNLPDLSKLEYYNPKTKEWNSAFTKSALLFDAAPEFSVRYDSVGKNWIAIYSLDGMSKDIMMRYAKDITGPWSAGKVIAQCPEVAWNKNYYGYEAKQSAILKGESSNPLNITYLINSTDFWDMAKDLRIGFPQVLHVPNPLYK